MARAVALLAHGFKGYKDYGFIPVLAKRLAEELPIAVHRFNFSHSGVGADPSTFERPDLFERDTWNKQVADLAALVSAVRAGEASESPNNAPIVLLGHSRGGVSCLLAAGRWFRDGGGIAPAAIITMSAPSMTNTMSDEEQRSMRERGYAVTTSSRTGQELRIGRAWLQEQEQAPADHDMLGLCQHIRCPVLAVHGEDDPTVPAECADEIVRACPDGTTARIIGGDHVYNTPNPADPDAPPSQPLAELTMRVSGFLKEKVLAGR